MPLPTKPAQEYTDGEIADFLATMFGKAKRGRFLHLLLNAKPDELHVELAAVAYGFKVRDVTAEMSQPIKTMMRGLFSR
jgi:hypothetical protein